MLIRILSPREGFNKSSQMSRVAKIMVEIEIRCVFRKGARTGLGSLVPDEILRDFYCMLEKEQCQPEGEPSQQGETVSSSPSMAL